MLYDSATQDLARELEPRLQGRLYLDHLSRAIYATDASLYQMKPLAVLVPQTMDDVERAVEAAARRRLPVLPRGGGSSLAGQAVGQALVIDFTKHLDAVYEINEEEHWAYVQPGITLSRLNRALLPYGLMVGPDPASGNRATLGGMVANNATGTHSILYGNMIRHVDALEVLLADGSAVRFDEIDEDGWHRMKQRDGLEGLIYRGLDRLLQERAEVIERDTPAHWRRNNGYRVESLLDNFGGENERERNIAKLLCGSEGTLAVTTGITVSLVPRPQRTALGIVHFRTRREALEAVTVILETDPSAVELLDGHVIEQTRRAPGFARRLTFLEGSPGGALITEYYGSSEDELNARLDGLEQRLRTARMGYAMVRVMDPDRIRDVWTVRKEGLGLLMGVKGDYKPVAVIEDAAVPVEHLAAYVEDLDRLLAETGTKAVYYAHASAGCLHVRPFLNTKDAREVEKLRAISVGSMELARRYGGVISSEHGDGIVRGWLNEELLGKELCDVYRDVKRLFDPDNIMNPGKVLDTPDIGSHLRMGPDYETIPVLESLDWSEDGGFARSIELCNGNGACRKLETGIMCPSFMVTRDEEHSTRGRANALRTALSGAAPVEELTGARMDEVMALCVQCKGCKTECPSNVDMAKIKSEWLNMKWQGQKPPLRTRLFAHQPRLARRLAGTPLSSVANASAGLKPVRWMMERTVGISGRRDMPAFVRETFTQRVRTKMSSTYGPPVVLFADTFNNCHTPGTALAAYEFLRRAGYQVIVSEGGLCCGRTYFSKGFITEAQQEALRTVENLYPYVEKGLPIIGLEPSCILSFVDEFQVMLPGDTQAKRLGEVAMTFETFIAREASDGRLEHLRWTDAKRKVLLHGHCHQKAIVGIDDAVEALSLPPNYSVEALDTSCCGMAGSFGYEREHLELSYKMAERRLAPAVRGASPETIIAAPGFSCRTQIKDVAEREAQHPAEVLSEALI